ncbi:RagB/SusD family nutrient uptake outer membrane protein [Parapedobacter indicus]|uniref:Starch-binding associating with outer membrane n=1 Tax=Parapedobacter indicus TaxID=1477437 RepID=A0A1I3J9Q7_9SPHI|nr:RagB/SusD family nutrient uptake outer membrane protein [Parapedobacter indicus]PPL02435.1 putative outer membrane starch-binding protein [Parapedobacter indicus]SFI56708.1 Starch-binding associating with outer membrane [Parapedobacter indicus]
MKTKNIAIALLCGSAFTFGACESFLDEAPRSAVTSVAYYQNEAQAQGQVNSLYRMGAPLRYASAGSAYIGPNASINSMLTGYFTNSYEGQELICLYSRELTRQNNTRIVSNTMNSIWNDCYRAINIANAAIKYIPEIEMDANLQSKLVGEAKFFRAYNYFYLVKTFGDLPLSTEPYEATTDDLYLPRTGTAEVYALIEADLKEAVDALPASTFANNAHRISRYAAAMALADVYLQQGKYGDAATYAQLVLDSPHGLTTNSDLALNSAYNKLRKSDDLDESIYALEYDGTINNSGWWTTYAFSSSATSIFTTYSIFERVYGPTDRFLNVYEAEDLRIQPNQFFHWKYTNPNTGTKWTSAQAGIWYYYDEDAVLNTGRGTKDWNLYRYAEALLIAAESIARSSGVNADAAGYLAQVKARADINGKTAADYTAELQSLPEDDFVEAVWTERLRELPLEFKMWDDCLRTGMFPVISASVKGQVDYQPLVGTQNGSGATFKETDLLWPISLDELQRNPKLTQNEGYQDIAR